MTSLPDLCRRLRELRDSHSVYDRSLFNLEITKAADALLDAAEVVANADQEPGLVARYCQQVREIADLRAKLTKSQEETAAIVNSALKELDEARAKLAQVEKERDELKRQNETFRNAQKACEDCETVTEQSLRLERDELHRAVAKLSRSLGNPCVGSSQSLADGVVEYALAELAALKAELARHDKDECMPRSAVEILMDSKLPCGHPNDCATSDETGAQITCLWCKDKAQRDQLARDAEGVRARAERLEKAWDAAVWYIQASPCDPDITDEQIKAYAAYKAAEEALATPAPGMGAGQ